MPARRERRGRRKGHALWGNWVLELEIEEMDVVEGGKIPRWLIEVGKRVRRVEEI
jgi:hypothetical protein